MDRNLQETLQHAVDALLTGASFNYDEGNTRQLVGDVRRALHAARPASTPVTFYYAVQTGRMEPNRRTAPRPRTPVPH